MIAWEETLAVRDSVFAKVAIITTLAICLYAAVPGWHKWLRIVGFLLFVVLFLITAVHVWQ